MPEAPVFVTTRRTFHVLGSAALAVAALYWGQKILMPFALAILLTFVLSPLVSWLEQRRIGDARNCFPRRIGENRGRS